MVHNCDLDADFSLPGHSSASSFVSCCKHLTLKFFASVEIFLFCCHISDFGFRIPDDEQNAVGREIEWIWADYVRPDVFSHQVYPFNKRQFNTMEIPWRVYLSAQNLVCSNIEALGQLCREVGQGCIFIKPYLHGQVECPCVCVP